MHPFRDCQLWTSDCCTERWFGLSLGLGDDFFLELIELVSCGSHSGQYFLIFTPLLQPLPIAIIWWDNPSYHKGVSTFVDDLCVILLNLVHIKSYPWGEWHCTRDKNVCQPLNPTVELLICSFCVLLIQTVFPLANNQLSHWPNAWSQAKNPR